MTQILVVDDEPGIREISARILANAGFAVDVAEDGEFAWQALSNRHYDLILTDQNMPRLDGAGLIARLHSAGLTVPVILMTGGCIVRPAAKVAPVRYLEKPFTFSMLIGEVNRILNPVTV